jgi:spermidine synthase
MGTTPLYYSLAFASGSAALIYQVAWSRMLALTFGSSILAVSAVVAGFMGGMGIGAWLYHRAGERAGNALKSYGVLEISIGLTAAAFTLLFIPLPEAFAAVAHVLPSGVIMDLTRVGAVFLLLVVPTALMGATYPALCDVILRDAESVERRLGWVYGLNTLGAAVGALAAGFATIELLGARGSVALAIAINVGIGTIALGRSRNAPGFRRTAPAGSDVSAGTLASTLPIWVCGVVLFGSGLATLGYEIVWFRALHYVMGSGTYVLSTALVIFLVGLGFGGTLYRTAIRSGRPEQSLGLAQLVIAFLAVLAMAAENWMLSSSDFRSRFSAFSMALNYAPWLQRVAIGFGVSVAIMLPATLSMGIVFPLASRLFLRSADGISARLGFAYLLSNLGSILGAVGAAVWILPALGTIGGTRMLVCVNLALGLLVLLHTARGASRLAFASLAALVLGSSMLLPARLGFINVISTGPPSTVQQLFEEESDRGTVQVFERLGDPAARSISIDGLMVGSTRAWNPSLHQKQTLLAHLPMSLDRSIRHTLNLGLASSSTLRTLADYDWVETLDVVEINPAVVRATRWFEDSKVLADPRTEVHVEDAVHYLLQTTRRYDLIISDAKQDPRFAGNSKVLSAELYDYSLDRLSECGLFVQFVALAYPAEYFSLIMRTFRASFEEVELFAVSPSLLLMVGSRCPIAGRDRPTIADLERTGVAREIARDFLPAIDALPALWIASGDELAEEVGEGPINSWDKLPMEFLSYRMEISPDSSPLANLETLMACRERAGPVAFTSLPHFGELQEFTRAWIDWFRNEKGSARHRMQELLKREPRNMFVREAYERLRSAG